MTIAPSESPNGANRCRVVVVGYSLSGGGAERFTSSLLNHLDCEQFEPHLATLTDEITYPIPADVPHTKLGFGGIFSLRRTVSRLRQTIAECRPQVILSTFDLPTLCVGFAIGNQKKSFRWIARLGLAVERPAFSVRDWISRLCLSRIYRRVDQFVANSQGLEDSFAKNYPCAAQKITTIHNPVDLTRLESLAAEPPEVQRETQRPLLVFVGRLHQQKRLDVLLDAYAQLREKFRPQLWIIGDGPLRAHLSRRIAKSGWQPDVRLFGFQSNPFPLVRQADLFLLTSDFEGLPNALLEAQALGVPAVSTRAKFGPEEIIADNVTGRLVPCGDVFAFAAACSELLADQPQLEAMARHARQSIAERFNLQLLIKKWESVIADIANRGH